MLGLLLSALTLTFFVSRVDCQLLQVLPQWRCGLGFGKKLRPLLGGLFGLPVQANCGLAHGSQPLFFIVSGIGWYTRAAPVARS